MLKEFVLISGGSPSSWTLRAWLMLKHLDVDFEEKVIELFQADSKQNILKHSPNGKVPALTHNGLVVWESLAIGEYLNELFPEGQLYPADQAVRAYARSICNEMHSGFVAIRQNMPFTLQTGLVAPTDDAMFADIRRVEEIWSECRQKYSQAGEYLLGKQFTLADAFFAPVALRFRAYSYVSNNADVVNYCSKIANDKYVQEWMSR